MSYPDDIIQIMNDALLRAETNAPDSDPHERAQDAMAMLLTAADTIGNLTLTGGVDRKPTSEEARKLAIQIATSSLAAASPDEPTCQR